MISGMRQACRSTSAGQARAFEFRSKHTRTSLRNLPAQLTVTASFGSPGFAATNSSRIVNGATVRAFFGLRKPAGIRTEPNAARAFPKYSAALNPVQTPCFSHSWRTSRRLGMTSIVFSTSALLNVREDAQNCGQPFSYCGHSPCSTNSYCRCPPHCILSRAPAGEAQYWGDHDSDSK